MRLKYILLVLIPEVMFLYIKGKRVRIALQLTVHLEDYTSVFFLNQALSLSNIWNPQRKAPIALCSCCWNA